MPGALLFVRDSDQHYAGLPDLIERTYGLTPAETRLVEQLLAGDSVADAAEQLGVTVGTARTRLKRVFQKTDTHSQADLMRLVLSTSGWLR